MFLLTLLTFLVLSAVYVLLNKKYAYWKERGVPFPQPGLFFGNTGRAVTLRTPMWKILYDMYNDYKGYAYVGFFNLWKPAIIIRDPELIKDILIKQFNHFHDNWFETEQEVDPSLANNPFVLQGNQWKTIRSQLTPQFTSSKIKSMYPLIQEVCKTMVKYIKNETESNGCNVFEVRSLCSRFTGDNVISCAFGLDGKSFTLKVPDSFKIGEQISSSSKVIQMKQTIGLFFPLLRKLFKTTFLGDPVPRMFWDIILEAIKYREENNINRNDYLGFLKELKVKPPMSCEITNDLLVGHAFTFFLNGFETSAITFSYVLLELALNPCIQDNARKEIRTILEKHNEVLSYEAVQEMEYVENVMAESLRKRPIIQFMSRVCTENYTFPPPRGPGTGKDVIIEKGTLMFISVQGIHSNHEYYPNPSRFDPNHFSEKAKNSRPKCSYLSFGDGPRICLGRKFAHAQIKLGLVTILRNFELKLNDKTILPIEQENLHVVNSPKSNIWVDFHPLF